jgi:hypothetical protein
MARLLIKDRGGGKSTGLLYTSEATGYPIITNNLRQTNYLKSKAKELNLTIPEPLTFEQFKQSSKVYKFQHILIDEGYDIISEALNNYLGCEVECATFTDRLHEFEVTKYEPRNNK